MQLKKEKPFKIKRGDLFYSGEISDAVVLLTDIHSSANFTEKEAVKQVIELSKQFSDKTFVIWKN